MRDRQEERETQAAEALADSEIANNRCTPEHATALQRASQHVQTVFAAMGQGSSPDFWTLESQAVVVAAPRTQVFRFDRTVAGEYHLFALSFLDIDPIVVERATEAIIAHVSVASSHSGYANAFRSLGGSIVGLTFRFAPGQRFAVGLRGRGCSLLLTYRHG